MNGNLGTIAGTVSLNIDPFESSTRVLQTQIRNVSSALKAQDAAIKASGNGLNSLKNNYNLTGKSLQAHNSILTKQKENYAKLTEGVSDFNKLSVEQKTKILSAEAAMNKTQAEIQQLTGSYKQLAIQIATQESAWTKVGTSMTNTGQKLQTVGQGMSSVGTKMTLGLTAPIVAGVGASIKAASDFESAFAGVQKTVDEAVDSNGRVTISYGDLRKGILDMSKELPSTASEISGVAESAGQLGIQTENVLGFTRTMIDMSEATNMSSEEAAMSLAKFANITQMSQKDFDKLGSSIVNLGNNTATTEADIVAMGLRLAGSGKQANMSESQIMGLSAAMSSVGINAESGGSSMSRAMQKMQTAVMSGNDKLELFAKMSGMTAKQFQKAWKDDAAGAITQFVKGLGKAKESGEDVTSALKDMGISSVQEVDTMLRLSGAGDTLSKSLKISSDGWKRNTALTKEAETRYATTESQLKMLKNEVTAIAIEFGGPFTKALREGLQTSKPFIKQISNLAESFSNASPETQQMVMKTLALTAAIGPASKVIGGLTTIVGGGIGTFGRFSTAIGKIQGKAVGTKLATEGLELALGTTATSTGVATKGVTGLVTGLTTLNPWVIGTGVALGAGVAVWKLWGEEAWNSAKRTQKWGSDVGESTDKALTTIQNATNTSTGEFNLMAQGFDTNTTSMINNFQKIGSTIEHELNGQIEAFKKSVDMLPEEIQDEASKIVQKATESREQTLKLVKDNNKRILDIKKKYVDEEGNITVQGAKMVQDLMRQSTSEYLKITVSDADARKEVMNALNADVSTATEKQAQNMLQTLGKQRQETKSNYNKQLEEYKEYLNKQGVLNTDEGKQLVKLFEDARDQSTDAFDAQMALIVEKYPELANKVSLANGQLASSMGEAGQYVGEANQKILDKAEDLSNKLAESARKNAEQIKWTADEATQSGKIWNSLELIDKEGNVKTNAAEIVTEATKDTNTWNQMRLVIHDANLDSNAKKVVGEAAIANGWWDGMAYEDKKAILQDDFSITMYDALRASGDWDNMTLEEKKAILYSNTPEQMASTMLDLGLWDTYEPEIKNLKADNFEFLTKIQSSETKLNTWNETPTEAKQLLINNMDVTTKLFNSETTLKRWNDLTPEQKTLLASNTDVLQKVLSSETKYNNWMALPEKQKKLSVNNTDAVNKTNQSQNLLDKHNKTGMLVKNLKANNSDSTSKTKTSQNLLDKHNRTGMLLKNLKANNSDSVSKTNASQSKLDKHNNTSMKTKNLTANNSDAVTKTNKAQDTLNTWKNTNVSPRTLTANTNASSAKSDIDGMNTSWRNTHGGSKSFTFTTIFKTIGQKVSGLFHAKGTNHHPGGNMIVNDQQGSTYRELVTLPSGQSFIPEGRNVFIPNAPKGTKVLKASDTKRLVPRYADGNVKLKDVMSEYKPQSTNVSSVSNVTVSNDNKELEKRVDELVTINEKMIELLALIAQKDMNTYIDGKSLTREVEKRMVRGY